MISFFSGFLLLLSSLLSCNSSAANTGKGINIKGTLTACVSDSIFVFSQIGNDQARIASAPIIKNGSESTFDLWVSPPADGIFLIGVSPNGAAKIILATNEKDLTFTGNCTNFQGSAQVGNSQQNKELTELMTGASQHMNAVRTSVNNLQMAMQMNPGGVTQLQQEYNNIQTARIQFLEGFVAKGGVIGKVANLLFLKPYGSEAHHTQKYADEYFYIAAEFFNNIDLSDQGYLYIPNLVDRAAEYGATLGSAPQINPDSSKAYFSRLLDKTPGKSQMRKVLYSGLLNGLAQNKNELYAYLGGQYLKEFPEPTAFTYNLEAEVKEMQKLGVGAQAPELNFPSPEGPSVSLSSLKGKVVLIDFWASWCRPCRAENPNVVRIYQKYHSKGFEILGVSLDKEKDKWVQAIQDDNLTWKHVSDLGGWQSASAKAYSVTSIPMTYLVDKEGNILGKGLRGPALEQKLQSIFGF